MRYFLDIELKLADFKPIHWLFHQNEWWKDIAGYERLYSISTLGRVKSFDRVYDRIVKGTKCKIIASGKILKPQIRKNGYVWVMLYKNSKAKCCNVHRLIMLTFIGESKKLVNHKDLNKHNNRLDNLEYCTPRENCVHFLESIKESNEVGIHFRKKKQIYEVRLTHLGIRWNLCGFVDKDFAIEVKNKYFDRVLDCSSTQEIIDIKKEIKTIYKNPNGTNKFTKRKKKYQSIIN